MKDYVFFFLLFLGAAHVNGQQILDSYIVDLKDNKAKSFLAKISSKRSNSIKRSKVISPSLDIVYIKTHTQRDEAMEKFLNNSDQVESWSYDYKAQKRLLPNDQYINLQWSLDQINMSAAWEVTTGGKDINDREVVIAIIDDSYDLTHPEIADHIWRNEEEIPDDGIDNDNNGYIDDYEGWNAINGSDNHPLTDNHGVAVAGIIGAKGNNEVGTAGINWETKMLVLTGINQSEVIENYEYVLNLRRTYNETNGEKGAYVVVTTLSAGVDNRFGTDPQFKSWCDMYDAMGAQGIVSCGATTNESTDVDVEGDIPTTCPSPYLISVTNVDQLGAIVPRAGFGATHIDLGAPGDNIYTLDKDDGYDLRFSGTSAATPHVAGVIGLLFTAPCSSLSNLAIDRPEEAALLMKDAILNGVIPNSTLTNITATGGRLDALGALEQLQRSCEELALPSPTGDLSIENVITTASGQLNIEYLTPDQETYTLLITDRMGKTIHVTDFNPPVFGRKVISAPGPLTSGIYIISIYNDDNISSKKHYYELLR